MTELDGKVAIVTGTSSGLGRRFAEVLDGAGARVVLASRRHEADLELAAKLRDALPVACDVCSPADREALVRAAADRFGQIDILVNNAGVAYSGPAEDESQEHLQDLIDTNLTAVFALTQLVGRHMLARGSGVIVNMASPSAAVSLDRYGLAGYGATKAGVVALTRELAYQWGGRGVRVNALAPSFFPTATTGWLADPEQVAWISANTPLGRPPSRGNSTARCYSWPPTPPATSPGRPSTWTAVGPAADRHGGGLHCHRCHQRDGPHPRPPLRLRQLASVSQPVKPGQSQPSPGSPWGVPVIRPGGDVGTTRGVPRCGPAAGPGRPSSSRAWPPRPPASVRPDWALG